MASTYHWKAGVNGNWVTGHHWDLPGSPSGSAAAVIDQPGTYAVTISAGATIDVAAVTLDSAFAQLDLYGTLQATHGITDDNGGIILEKTGTFAAGATLTLGGSAGLVITSSRTLDNIRVEFSPVGIGEYPLIAVDGTTTLGSHAVLAFAAGIGDAVSGGFARTGPTLGVTGSMINHGTILVEASAEPSVQLDLFDNAGLLSFGAGAAISTQTDSAFTDFVNSGSIQLAAGATLGVRGQEYYVVATSSEILEGAFSSTGTITLAKGAVLEVDVSLNSTSLANIVSSGGTILVTGTLDNTGNTLNFSTDDSLASLLLASTGYTGAVPGVLTGGTLVAGAAETAFAMSPGTLQGVTQIGELVANGLSFDAGLTLLGGGGTGPGTLDAVNFTAVDNETLAHASLIVGDLGNALGLTLGASLSVTFAADAYILSHTFTGSLTNDANLTVATNVLIGEDEFTNNGRIGIAKGGTLQFESASVFNTSSNLDIQTLGSLTVAAGAALVLGSGPDEIPYVTLTTAGLVGLHVATGGTFQMSAQLDNTGATMDVTPASVFNGMGGGGYIDGGTILLNGGSFEARGLADLTFRAGPSGVFDLDNYVLTDVSLLGHNAAGGGTFEVASQSYTELYPELQMTGVTVDGVTVFGSTGVDDSFAPEYDLNGINTFGKTAQFTGLGDFVVNAGATLTNQGTVSAAYEMSGAGSLVNSGLLSGSGAITVASVTNSGTIEASSPEGQTAIAGITGSGLLLIDSGGAMSLPNVLAASQTVDFGTGGGTVWLGSDTSQQNLSGFDPTIENFKDGGNINIFDFTETTFDVTGGVLTVMDNGTTVFTHDFGAGYTKANFDITNSFDRIFIAGTA